MQSARYSKPRLTVKIVFLRTSRCHFDYVTFGIGPMIFDLYPDITFPSLFRHVVSFGRVHKSFNITAFFFSFNLAHII